jgi:2-polyprenyl-3-methyl-5-hydroxy-6-metoxy-1,4-benzoquinol methylase
VSNARTFKEFVVLERQVAEQKSYHDASYFEAHSRRLYTTYVVCADLLDADSAKLVSFGAGSAYIEHALANWHRARVTIVDLPERVDLLRHFYEECGFDVIAADVTAEIRSVRGKFDVALSSELIEHIPRPPVEHIRLLGSAVRPGGDVVVTTPNFGNIRVIGRLLLMRPVLPPPERTFGAVSFENQDVHRREYLPSEIIDAFRTNGIRHLKTIFTENRTERRIALGLAVKSVPRFRATMILHGKNDQPS